MLCGLSPYLRRGGKVAISETSNEDKWPKETSVRGNAEKPLPHLSLVHATVSIHLSPFPLPASHFVFFLLSIILIEHFWGLWCMKDYMWSALDQCYPFSSCFALIVLLALCLAIHLFHLSGCWKVAFSLEIFSANFSLFYYMHIVQGSD